MLPCFLWIVFSTYYTGAAPNIQLCMLSADTRRQWGGGCVVERCFTSGLAVPKGKSRFYIERYPILRIAQSIYTLLPDRLVQSNTVSASLGSLSWSTC